MAGIKHHVTYLCPESGVDNIKSFQIFLVLVFQDVVDFPHPRHRRVIMPLGKCMEVEDYVITFD